MGGVYWHRSKFFYRASDKGEIEELEASKEDMVTNSILIKNGVIITVNSINQVITKGALLIQNRRIVAIGATEELESQYSTSADKIIDGAGKVVLPGFINLHLHSGLIRGTAEDLPLWEWLAKYVDPMHRVLQEDEAYVAAKLCYAEAIKSGTTCVLDMYRYMHRCADAATEIGIRAVLAPYVADEPGYDYFETLEENELLIQEKHGCGNGRVHVWIGLEHLTYCTEEAFRKARELADHYGVGIHTHGAESLEMAERVTAKYKRRFIEIFYDRGILGPKTVLAHCVWLRSNEVELLAKTNTSVAHCPVSNMKIASGVAPIPQYLCRGVNVGIGTDGVKENNNLDMIEEMKFVSLLQKVNLLDAAVMPAVQVLRMATINGAVALGLEKEIGSLEVGKKADVIIVDFQKLHLAPYLTEEFQNIIPNLVYAAHGQDVETVLIDGQIVMENRKLTYLEDEKKLIEEVTDVTKTLLQRRREFVLRRTEGGKEETR